MSAANALQAALFARLTGDGRVTALVAPGRIRDRLFDTAELPTLLIASIDSRDWSTATEPGEEHTITIEARSGEGGHRPVQAIAAAVRASLHDAALPLAGHALVNLRHERTLAARDAAARGHLATLTFRAVTEPHAP